MSEEKPIWVAFTTTDGVHDTNYDCESGDEAYKHLQLFIKDLNNGLLKEIGIRKLCWEDLSSRRWLR